MSEKKRINVTLSKELFDWCDGKAKEYGLSVPALFVVAMAQYKDQNFAMNELPILMKQIEGLQKTGQIVQLK